MKRLGQLVGAEANNPSLMGKSTTRIALLAVSSVTFEYLPNLNISPPNKRGDLLLAVGAPFGILSPAHFCNSISVGSLANCYPPSASRRSLLMADIRCLPGMEGSPVFGEHAELVGILTRPLRQRGSGAEVQLVIPWEAIATACSDLLLEEPQYERKGIHCNDGNFKALGSTLLHNNLDSSKPFNYVHEHHFSHGLAPSPVEKAMASICLITVDDGVWASGVFLNERGLILTNAHLLEPWRFRKAAANEKESRSNLLLMPSNKTPLPQKETELRTTFSSLGDEHGKYKSNLSKIDRRCIRVRLDHMDPWIWCDARVLYVSKGPLDIALLQLEFVPYKVCPITMDFTCPFPGSKAYVIGHGLFGPRSDLLPSACLGVVAKVVKTKRPLAHLSSNEESGQGFPAMIETTAAVHPGGSGGAVVNSDGYMIGLVTSNARHGGGTVIPHLNFSIPCAALEPIFKYSKDMQDLSLLDYLDKPNEDLSSVWALMPPLSPKPGPSLPNLPPILQRDKNKDIKGSRFAKFMAERQELLKNTSQQGKVESIFTKPLPSKL